MPIRHINVIGLIRRHVRRQHKIIDHTQAQNRKNKDLLDSAAAQECQVIKARRHKFRKQEHGKKVPLQEKVKIGVRIHAQPVFTLFPIHIQGILPVIALSLIHI